jgi:hypothetical protein
VLGRRFPVIEGKMSDEILWCGEKRIEDCQWHAVHCKVDAKGKVKTWNDVQKQRPKGPNDGDYVAYFEMC